jgi:carboxyl-terminal processing protease
LGRPLLTQVRADEEAADTPLLFRHIDRKLESSYLDLERIRPRELILRALGSLELAGDEIYVDSADPENPYVALYVEDKVRVFPLNQVQTRADSVRLLENIFDFVGRHYHGENTLNDLRYAAANGYLSGIDPHTLVFTPKGFEEFETHISGRIYGVGMLVGSTKDGKLEVRQVLKGTPAHGAGFKRGDLIVKIDDESAISMTVMEAVQKIRGPRGTEVVLTVKRHTDKDGDGMETLSIPVKRDRVVIKSVESKLLRGWDPDGKSPWQGPVGYVKVTNFDEQTYRGLRTNLSRLETENDGKPLAALILDLRENSGGLLTQAVQMADALLRKGDIVLTAQKDEITSKAAEDDGSEPDYPVVVLADQGSASGAEIVIGALQKNNRAIVLGTNTFGKGSVQQLHELPNGAQLKITVSEYLLPGKVSIQENGVVPDIFAQPLSLEKNAFDLVPDTGVFTEREYEAHIVSKFARPEEPTYRLKYLLEENGEVDDGGASTQERFIAGDIEPEKDPLVRMALKIIGFADKPFDPKQTLSQRKDAFQSLEEEFYDAVVKKLAGLGIDWSKAPPDAPAASSDRRVEIDLSSKIVEEPSADKDDPVPVNHLLVTARATNRGDRTLYRLKGISRSDYYLFDEQEVLFGKLEAGQTVERHLKIRLPYFGHAQNNLITLELSLADDKVFFSQPLAVEVAGKDRPLFAYKARLVDKDGARIERLPAEGDVKMLLSIENVGKGPAHKAVAILRNKTGREVFLEKGRIEFSDLQPGAQRDVEFAFSVRPGRELATVELELVIFDSYSGETLTRKLEIPTVKSKAEPFANDVVLRPPVIDMSLVDAERGETVLVTDAAKVRVRAQVSSTDGKFKTWITSLPASDKHKNPDKIFFAESHGDEKLQVNTPVSLSPGVNIVTLTAKDGSGIEARRSLVVRRKQASS